MLFTPGCHRAIQFACTAYPCLGHPCLSSAHLLLGLLKVETHHRDVLRRAHLTFQSVKYYLSSHPLPCEASVRVKDVTLGASARSVLDRAEAFAKENHERLIWTSHVLFALVEEQQGPTSELLNVQAVDRSSLREHIKADLERNEMVRREKRRRRRLLWSALLHPEFWADPEPSKPSAYPQQVYPPAYITAGGREQGSSGKAATHGSDFQFPEMS
jgi:ATP-dependent Clp protease ATP-binding subunit ClpA